MPIYEYKCSSCGHQQEYLHKVSDPQLTRCPACGQEAFSKMVTAAGFQLKGSGWYATDFKGSGSKPAASGAAKSEGDKSEGAKSEGAEGAQSEGAKSEAAKSEGGKTESAKGEAKSESKKESTGPSSAAGGNPSGS